MQGDQILKTTITNNSYIKISVANGLNPTAVKVMQEIGIDISNQYSKKIQDLENLKFDIVITVCDHANQTCPYLPGIPKRIHISTPDPAKNIEEFRRVRDMIEKFCTNLEFINATRLSTLILFKIIFLS